MKILITGGAGFIGSNFIHYMMGRYPKVQILNFDKLTYSGNLANLKDVKKKPNYAFVKGDITDVTQVGRVFASFKPTHVVNFAAETHVDRSIHESARDFVSSNIDGVLCLLEAVRELKIERFLHISTDEVYGSLGMKSKRKFREDSPFAPNSPYSASKAAGDLLCRAYFATWGVPVIVTHSSNNFGPYQYPEKLIPFFITRLLAGKKVPLYGDGLNVRDWIHVDDHCRALDLALFKGKFGERYNIGTDCEFSNKAIAKRLLSYFGKGEDQIEYVSDRPGHDRRYSIDASKIRKDLGWKPKVDFDVSFKKTIDWYVDNQNWLKALENRKFNKHLINKK
ncbi:MAG: dTDP-glucose 4,6-dehydratase [Candidatus Harrisonbacteria bacterium CG10_big_fil_rev_8_21_14_0_10_45_28]|uniref:dTDP-glucose 4,6-dehydratase n=1 Tax=Candidatus Harrisonbacteria bacterium CG10_big_fil_rev_8_21_14_0_10_45_28 TaxID=1974586 RepID=A0A2H0UMM9_9BACT|nr:MAG: dTDP-glucose 4,6-dehydratase [Candidatus Harrisonbacteria bacterium CG10_big_fil_rev_8_21_14_0_10_45_28]